MRCPIPVLPGPAVTWCVGGCYAVSRRLSRGVSRGCPQVGCGDRLEPSRRWSLAALRQDQRLLQLSSAVGQEAAGWTLESRQTLHRRRRRQVWSPGPLGGNSSGPDRQTAGRARVGDHGLLHVNDTSRERQSCWCRLGCNKGILGKL